MSEVVILSKPWSYRLYTENDKPFLEVLVGSSALYEKIVPLSEDDFILCQANEKYLENLVNKIRENE